MVWDNIENRYAPAIKAAMQAAAESDVAVLSVADAEISATADVEVSSSDDNGTPLSRAESCQMENTAALLLLELPAAGSGSMPFIIAPRTGHDTLRTMGVMIANASSAGADLASFAGQRILPQFSSAYRSVLKLATMMGLPRIQNEAALTRATIVGKVSTYNPQRDGKQEGDGTTASGEPYDPAGWTAAIQTDLRNQFGGVRYGKLYQPVYALVESGEKQVIVKINDVGRLKPGRVLDLNERSMRHFDPFLNRGLIEDVKITLLPGEGWTPGPVGVAYAIDFTTAPRPTGSAGGASIEVKNWESDMEPAQRPYVPLPSSFMREDARAEAIASTGG